MRAHYDALLSQLDSDVFALGVLVSDTIHQSMRALCRRDLAEATRIITADRDIDAMRDGVERSCINLIATQQPAAGDLRTITGSLTVARELERIGDYAKGIARITLRMEDESPVPSMRELQYMSALTQRLVRDSMRAFGDRDLETASEVWSQDDKVDALYEAIFRDTLATMVREPNTVRQGTFILWVAHNLERMADRATNISESVVFIVAGDLSAFRADALAHMPPR